MAAPMPEITSHEHRVLCGALSSQLRYCQRQLERAREKQAIDRWARDCMVIGDLLYKLGVRP